MTGDLVERFRTADVDPVSREVLAQQGLDYRTVVVDDRESAEPWAQAVRRGFLDGEATAEQLAASLERSGYRRLTGVFDRGAPEPRRPVATIASWISELTVPGGAVIPACAISAVTVAPTHRRRGIARAMLEGELRTASAAGAPIAMLTVSESTLYGRYGFAPAASSAALVLDVKRARWIGPTPGGRVDFIPRERWRELIGPLHDRVRPAVVGEIAVPAGHWDAFGGTRPDAKDAEKLRAVQYRDEQGEIRGLALYSVEENHDDFTRSRVDLSRLDAETDDAYAALWRFFVELDLVGEVRAGELSVDEPVLWMIDDRRAATVTVQDHQYVRLLDVPAALAARRYAAPGILALDIDDPLDLASGRWAVEAAGDGTGVVHADAPDGAVEVVLGIRDLSAVYLGGVSLATLARAGRVQADDPDAATRVLSWPVVPRLSLWY